MSVFLQRQLTTRTSLVLYGSPEKVSLHAVIGNVPLGKYVDPRSPFRWRYLCCGEVCTQAHSWKVSPRNARNELDERGVTRLRTLFGEGSDLIIGAQWVPGLTGFSMYLLGRGKWLKPFGTESVMDFLDLIVGHRYAISALGKLQGSLDFA
jgi:hypothetical protein